MMQGSIPWKDLINKNNLIMKRVKTSKMMKAFGWLYIICGSFGLYAAIFLHESFITGALATFFILFGLFIKSCGK